MRTGASAVAAARGTLPVGWRSWAGRLAQALMVLTAVLTQGASMIITFAWMIVPAAARAADSPAGLIPLSRFPREPLVIETRSARRHEFEAWRADTPETHAQGLMFVREMRADQAMIFVYEPPTYVSMWMKNTLLPLDMLFVNRHGCVIKVSREARPGSLETISAGGLVALVVELKGGTAAALGVAAGDRVLRPAVGWPGDFVKQSCP